MKYLAAYCLAVLGGKATPTADDLTTILQSVGITPEETQLNAVMTALSGKSLHEVSPFPTTFSPQFLGY